MDVMERIKTTVEASPIVLFMKGTPQFPQCGFSGQVVQILDHIGESTQPPRIAPARGPPLWEAAAAAEQAGNDLQWDSSAQPAPEIEFDQRIAW